MDATRMKADDESSQKEDTWMKLDDESAAASRATREAEVHVMPEKDAALVKTYWEKEKEAEMGTEDAAKHKEVQTKMETDNEEETEKEADTKEVEKENEVKMEMKKYNEEERKTYNEEGTEKETNEVEEETKEVEEETKEVEEETKEVEEETEEAEEIEEGEKEGEGKTGGGTEVETNAETVEVEEEKEPDTILASALKEEVPWKALKEASEEVLEEAPEKAPEEAPEEAPEVKSDEEPKKPLASTPASRDDADAGGEDDEGGSAGDQVVLMSAKQKGEFIKTDQFAKLSQALTPPLYCRTAVNGEKGTPTSGKVTNGLPTASAAAKIAKIMATERECWFVDKVP